MQGATRGKPKRRFPLAQLQLDILITILRLPAVVAADLLCMMDSKGRMVCWAACIQLSETAVDVDAELDANSSSGIPAANSLTLPTNPTAHSTVVVPVKALVTVLCTPVVVAVAAAAVVSVVVFNTTAAIVLSAMPDTDATNRNTKASSALAAVY